MKSGKSFFSPAVFGKNIKRYWVLVLLYTLLYLLVPLFLWTDLNTLETRLNRIETLSRVFSNPIITMLLVIPSVLCTYGYLFHTRSSNMLHAFPITRGALFVTNTLTAYLMLALPQCIAGLVSMAVLPHTDWAKGLPILWGNLLAGLLIDLFFIALMSLASMLTGTWFMAPALYMIANFLYLGLDLLYVIITEFTFGAAADISTGGVLTPVVEILSFERLSDLWIYVVAAVILLLLSFLAYKRKAVETAEEILSVSWMRPLFRWIGAYGIAMVSAFLVVALRAEAMHRVEGAMLAEFLCWFVFFAALAFFLLEMLLQKRLRVFERVKLREAGAFLAASVVVILGLRAGAYRYYNRIPAADEIEAVYVEGGTFGNEMDLISLKPEVIESVRACHAGVLRYRESIRKSQKSTLRFYRLNLHYLKKNGALVSCRYDIPQEALKNAELRAVLQEDYLELFDDTDVCKSALFSMDYASLSARVLSFDHFVAYSVMDGAVEETYDESYVTDTADISPSQAQEVYEAILADIDEGAMGDYQIREDEESGAYLIDNALSRMPSTWLYLTLDYTGEGTPQSVDYGVKLGSIYGYYGALRQEEIGSPYYLPANIRIGENCTHTIQKLIDLGVIQDEEDLFRIEER